MAQRWSSETHLVFDGIKAGLLAIYKGHPPAIAIEFAKQLHDFLALAGEQVSRGLIGE